MLVELLYECQEKLWAWKAGFYPWSGGLAAKVAGGFREMFLTILVGAMLQLSAYQISPVTPLAPLGCSTPTTQTVETVPSSPLFPSPAFLPKSTGWGHDDTGSRNFHPKGLVENNFCVFQIFVRNLFLFPDTESPAVLTKGRTLLQSGNVL